MRGGFEEGSPVYQNGTFVNGFYESWPIAYPEDAYGLARTGQTILGVMDSKIIKLYVDDEPFYLPTATLLSFERALNMKEGTLDRAIIWETPSGKQVSIRSRRLISFEHRHLAALFYEVTLLNAEAPVVISSEMSLDMRLPEKAAIPARRGISGHGLHSRRAVRESGPDRAGHRTQRSGMRLACGVDHLFETACPFQFEAHHGEDSGKAVYLIEAKEGLPIQLTKYMTYHTSRCVSPEELCERAERTLSRAMGSGFVEILEVNSGI